MARSPSTLVSKDDGPSPTELRFFRTRRRVSRCIQGFAKHRRATELAQVSPFCQAIHLVLKAYLAQHGVNYCGTQRRLGHDLTKLYDKALTLGLRPSNPGARSHVQALNEARAKHWPRYPPLTGPVYKIEYFEPFAEDLFETVRPVLYRRLVPG